MTEIRSASILCGKVTPQMNSSLIKLLSKSVPPCISPHLAPAKQSWRFAVSAGEGPETFLASERGHSARRSDCQEPSCFEIPMCVSFANGNRLVFWHCHCCSFLLHRARVISIYSHLRLNKARTLLSAFLTLTLFFFFIRVSPYSSVQQLRNFPFPFL